MASSQIDALVETGNQSQILTETQHGLTRHGQTRGYRPTKIYQVWHTMKSRCLNKNDKKWPRYGGRGITIAPEWLSFEVFYRDMGDAPQGMTLDRIENDLGYSKENCRWATPKEQARNRGNSRFIEVNGERKTIAEWAEIFGVNHRTLRSRLKCGWDFEKAISTPVLGTGIQFRGERKTVAEWAAVAGIDINTLRKIEE